ncbi:MAG: hypothetical protein RL156_1769 [Bacteroidota bacterium]|jgi:predicted transcriptional regulator
MEKRLIPYSVHLPEHIYNQIKQAAEGRKASGLVRQAITAFIENGDLYNQGYATGLADAANKVSSNKLAKALAYEGQVVSDVLVKEIKSLNK